MAWMVSQKHPLRGLRGGDDAGPYGNRFLVGTDEEYEVQGAVNAQLPAQAVIAYQYGGGAGFEDPLQRSPEAVRDDVLDEYVSLEAAREAYGVVLTGDVESCNIEIDGAATAALRASRDRERSAG